MKILCNVLDLMGRSWEISFAFYFLPFFYEFIFMYYFQVSIMVFICVVFSVINVCGYAHFMGLTIEMVTSISLILSVGLALDYAAHYGVIFACLKTGTREEKMRISLE